MTVAKYLRLSAEDSDLNQSGKQESNSIANQRDLLDSFIARNADLSGGKIVEFCDDGWSGKNFERPAVKQLLSLAKAGKIQCIIVKDMSRFGRDYLTVGNYISRVFPFLGVRFIAVNDGVDSIRPTDVDSLDTSFKALLYDLYSRDLSRKVRNAKRFRAQKGEYLAARPLYGYVKDPRRKKHLVIDPPAAETVRLIFSMVGGGATIAQTAKMLNHEGIPTPMQCKTAKGMYAAWNCIGEVNFWTEAAVLRVIRNEQYLGSTVYGKRFYDIIGQGHSVKVSKKDWIIVADAHEPIVSQEEFDRAQAALREYKERNVTAGIKKKIRCGGCGHAMERHKAKHPYFKCRTPQVTDAFLCPQERILEQDIYSTLLDSLKALALAVVDMDNLIREQNQHNSQDLAAMRRSLTVLHEQLVQLKRQAKSEYEAFALGEVSKEMYLSAKATIREREDDLSAQIAELETSIERVQLTDNSENGLAAKFQRYVDIEEITQEILDDVLDEVRVFPGGQLVIQWKYQDEILDMFRLHER